jgi:hypothetical protein
VGRPAACSYGRFLAALGMTRFIEINFLLGTVNIDYCIVIFWIVIAESGN